MDSDVISTGDADGLSESHPCNAVLMQIIFGTGVTFIQDVSY